MSDSDLPEDDRALAGEFVLGLMTLEEEAAFRKRFESDRALFALVNAWRHDFVALVDEVEEVTPPIYVRRRLERQLFEPRETPRWLMWGIPGVLAAVLALVLVISPLNTVRPPSDPVYHADLASEEGVLILAAGYDGDTGELYVIPELAPEEGTAHELWLIEGGNAPVSLGLLPADAPARLAVSQDVAERLAGGVLAISVEPPTGSPTGAPTGPVIATGQIETL